MLKIRKPGFTFLNILFLLLISLGGSLYFFFFRPVYPLEDKFVTDESTIRNTDSPFKEYLNHAIETGEGEKEETIVAAPDKFEISQKKHIYQTFNNCGPATLSMLLSYYDISADQNELGKQMRPYQNSQGDNDDKAVFANEFTYWAEEYGHQKNLIAIARPNGSLELLKLLISNDIPVVTTNLLNNKEDIGHFLLIRGYDDQKAIFIADDTYYGPNRKYGYYDFMSLWQPFNYLYIIAYTDSQADLVRQILGSEWDENIAWQNSITRAQKEHNLALESIYPLFNLSVSYYHVGDYVNSIKYFEEVENKLPKRMLWYQIEPIEAYQAQGNYDKVFSLTQNILDHGNRAFSELYYIRGQIYQAQGKKELAKNEYEKAIFYHSGYKNAEEALKSI